MQDNTQALITNDSGQVDMQHYRKVASELRSAYIKSLLVKFFGQRTKPATQLDASMTLNTAASAV